MASCRVVTDVFDENSAFIIKVTDILDTVTIRQDLPMFRSLRFSFSGPKISLILNMKAASSNAT